MIKLIITIFLLTNSHLISDELFPWISSWYVMQFNYINAILILLITIFNKIPKSKINERSLLALFISYIAFNILSYWPWVYNYDVSFPLIIILIVTFICRLYIINNRNYKYEGDKIKENNFYLCLEKPKTTRGIFTSLIGAPYCSISVYVDGELYGFKWGLDYYVKRKITKLVIQREYIVFDTFIESNIGLVNMLNELQGKTATTRYFPVRMHCVLVIKDFLNKLGSKYKVNFFEFLPSVYTSKLIGIKNDRKRVNL